MLSSTNARTPLTVLAGETLSGTIIEANLGADEVLLPKVAFYNFGTEAVLLTIVRVFDLGSSAEEANDGSSSKTLVDDVSIPADGVYVFTPELQALVAADSAPYVQHTVSLDGEANLVDNIIQMVVSGLIEETTRSNILNFSRT